MKLFYFDNPQWKDNRIFVTDKRTGTFWTYEAGVLLQGTPTEGKKHHTSIEVYKRCAVIGTNEKEAREKCVTLGEPLSEDWEVTNAYELSEYW